jgi:RNA polymerase sigma-70 factor (ECF subfamily)
MRPEIVLEKEFLPRSLELPMRKDEALSEKDILERVQRGDKGAYQIIVTRYMKKAYFIALGFVHNHQDALDLSQDAFIKAFRRIKDYNTQRPFFPWLYEITKNLCLDHLRRQKQKKEVPLNGVRILGTEDEDREMKRTLWKGIDALPFEQKEIILLRYFQQLSYLEIAAITGKPIGTVMSSLYYAKARLKQVLGQFLGLPGKGRKSGVSDGS